MAAGRTIALSLLSCVAFAACGRGPVEAGRYRAALKLPGGELPFALELKRDGAAMSGLLGRPGEPASGVPADGGPIKLAQVIVDGPTLKILIRGDESQILAQRQGATLEGAWVMRDASHQEHRIAFEARREASYRFFEKPSSDNADISGRWSVTFNTPTGLQSGTAEFAQSHAEVDGRFSLSGGDSTNVAGEVHNDDIYLSSFDGTRAFLFKATVTKDGSLKGEFWSASGEQKSWTAKRDASAESAI
jgi:hypothetical protein